MAKPPIDMGEPKMGVGDTLTQPTLCDVARYVNQAGDLGTANFGYTYDYDSTGGKITRLSLIVARETLMPVWTNRGNRPAAEQKEWDRFCRALLFHENGHHRITAGQAAAVRQALLSVRGKDDNDLAQLLGAKKDEETLRVQGLQDAFDVKTGHGATQTGCPDGTTVINVTCESADDQEYVSPLLEAPLRDLRLKARPDGPFVS
jgi:hypothetical protein